MDEIIHRLPVFYGAEVWMETQFHPTPYDGCEYLSMLRPQQTQDLIDDQEQDLYNYRAHLVSQNYLLIMSFIMANAISVTTSRVTWDDFIKNGIRHKSPVGANVIGLWWSKPKPFHFPHRNILLPQGISCDLVVNIRSHAIPRNDKLKMLGVTLGNKLNFKTHIRNICQKAARQINAL